jgi:hypothetical protein
MEGADARSLAECVRQVLSKYDIDENVQFIVTDTTRVMPAMVKETDKNRSPCWGHIYNLILSKIVDALRSECLDELFQFTAHSTHWRKLVSNATKDKTSALPTYTVTRWHSLWKLLDNAQKIKDKVNQWLVEEKREPISGGTSVRLAELLTIVSRFKNATDDIKRDMFGTLSYVYDGLMLLQLVWQNSKWSGLAVGWQPAHAGY